MRYKATQKQIKAAREYFATQSCLSKKETFFQIIRILFLTDKAVVLKHHPDKRRAAGEQITEGDNDYFTCITKGSSFFSFKKHFY